MADGASSARILIVEDDTTLRESLQYTLKNEGYAVMTAADGYAALRAAQEAQPNLVLLDLMLPGIDGLEVCRVLRRTSSVPIMMLTAKREEIDKVLGLELGADDYLTKPFSMRELLARVRAMLRRGDLNGQHDVPVPVLESGDLTVDLVRHEASRNHAPLHLKPREFDLLAFFMRHRGRAFDRERLLDQVWGYDFAGAGRTVDVHIRWLREKIEDEPSRPVRLTTVRGTGYRFEG
ncbi:MAG: response regulator transcription factor [Dehalococcoidia bacterium]|nr:response regulator transcription factor [Dehalococcoidia bacterium]